MKKRSQNQTPFYTPRWQTRAGDSFSVDEYNQFFYNGKMDNGMDFGYTITIKGIVESGADSTATIVIFKK